MILIASDIKLLELKFRKLKSVQEQINTNLMGFIFSVYCRQKLHLVSVSLVNELSQLQGIFPTSLFLQGQKALAFYQMQGTFFPLIVCSSLGVNPLSDVYEANILFCNMALTHPRHLDFMDAYSNMLYTLGSRERLAFIAHLCSTVDSLRPETCCVIGKYYSLCNRHEDAVSSFRRALALDGSFDGAWILLGYEYTKLQNAHAAIECYRRAIGLNQHDYRGFAGLGQSYESLGMLKFALYYNRRALKLRPRDTNLLLSISNCLDLSFDTDSQQYML